MKIRTVAFVGPLVTLACTLMSIQTGNYSTSEKWGYSGLTWAGFLLMQGLVELVTSGR
jgi:hypothetical protein